MDKNTSRNQSLVDEVMRFAETGAPLQPIGTISGARFRVIEDFAEALEFAYHRTLTEADDARNWTDLREQQVGKIHGVTTRDPALASLPDDAAERGWQLFKLLEKRLPAAYAEIIDDVSADLENCAYSRAAFGAGDRLFDQIWDAYRQGGWPCGWIGEFPDGDLVVFQPPVSTV